MVQKLRITSEKSDMVGEEILRPLTEVLLCASSSELVRKLWLWSHNAPP